MTAFENNAERVPCWECRGEGGEAIGYDGRGGVRRLRCRRCQGKGTVLVDKPCKRCKGKGERGNVRKWTCDKCYGTGVEPRDKRMERLMREAVQYYGSHPICTAAGTDQMCGFDMKTAMDGLLDTDPRAAFTGWCVADWQMRKGGQG